jgi:lipid II:glycine glycyltransferase (peptidoglycan interpeptide bridge formation enzyme)
MTAGNMSGNGLAIVTDDLNKHSEIFLREILTREKRLSNYSIFSRCAPALPGVIVKQNHTFHLDLTKPLEETLLSMRKSTRWAIRKAQKNDVEIDVLNSMRALRETYAITAAGSRREGFLIPRLKWLENIHHQFSNCGDSVSVLASYKGDLVSAAYFLGYDGKINWMLGGSTSAGNEIQAGSLVQMKIIEWAKALGYRVYDMGGTVPDDSAYGGIHYFKSGFGGRLVSNVVLERKTLFKPLVLKLYTVYRRMELARQKR